MPSDTDVVPGRRFGVPGRIWAVVVLLGLVGQVAWTVENMYLNVFIYNTITTDPNVIAITVAASAVAATLATMLVGAGSDRARTRRPFIAFGYVVWGVLTALFGVIRPGADTAAAIAAAAVAVVALDCVMSFFGSGANDAAFNAWITDSTVPGNRGRGWARAGRLVRGRPGRRPVLPGSRAWLDTSPPGEAPRLVFPADVGDPRRPTGVGPGVPSAEPSQRRV